MRREAHVRFCERRRVRLPPPTLLMEGVKGRQAEQLQGGLEHRAPIEQTKGVLIAEDGIDAATAVERLRTAARSSRQPVTDLVRDLIAGWPCVSYFDGWAATKEKAERWTR